MSWGLDRDDLETLLERLELLEDPLLSWGAVASALSEQDVEGVVEDWLIEGSRLLEPLEVIDALLDAGFLVRADDTSGYRTRVAEFLRLLVGLRQLFPARNSAHEVRWRGAPTLVGGLRYTRRPRQYPVRDVDAVPLMEELTPAGSAEREVFRQLTSGLEGEPLKLSGFQARAARTILRSVDAGRSSGAIVGAGTGSGKTLAFYLPALAHLVSKVGRAHRLVALALYPRNELLRDQLQAGLEQVLRLNQIVHERVGRPIRVGVLFGAVPQTVRALKGQYYRTWRRQGEAFVCPYLTCPGRHGQGCGGDLLVRTATLDADEPALTCVSCAVELDPDVFPVTRDQLRRRPPDLLYCSTEMLNRSLLDPSTAHVLGVDVKPGPDLVLLDEVHSYGGTSGAMTALSLRRWRHRVRSKPVFVGLSATLVDAPQFFGDLVGLPGDLVVDVTPDPEELVPEGAEYQIVVRGDPTSNAGLLSTTIQTAMLLGRTMDPPGEPRSLGLFGRRIFAFTDDLDVTNRLYFDMLDAEGQRHRSGSSHLAYKPSLARLRSPALGGVASRRRAGQVWDLAVATGHGLGEADRLRVGRTSSQDTGLDASAEVIVATASLEVGVDDPHVGAVLQHKAPRESAAFLQRQGRAGRERGMRPLTVVVLSDYGRDRLAYEAWDQLLSPILRPSALPVGNVHVLRIQAALAALEWAIAEAGTDVRGQNMWNVLSGPSRRDPERAAQKSISEQFGRLLESSDAQASLIAHLQSALDLERSAAEDLLWQQPRPVLLAAVPALLRRISDEWRLVDDSGPVTVASNDGEVVPLTEDAGARQPLPSFVPPTLFSPLALPEVLVDMPAWSAKGNGERSVESLELIQALRELAPGRVTRRFAVASDLDRAWVPVASDSERLDISRFVTLSQSEGEVDGCPLVRPLRLRTEQPSEDLRDSTHGRPIWASEIRAGASGVSLRSVPGDPLGRIVVSMESHLHRNQQQLEVRRGMTGSDVRIVFRDGSEHTSLVGLTRGDEQVALGGSFDVDGLRFRVDVSAPDNAWSGETGPGLRAAWFEERLQRVMSGTADHFSIGWLHDVLLTGLLRTATDGRLSLEQAWGQLRSRLAAGTSKALEILLAAPGLDATDPGEGTGKLVERIRDLLADPAVLERLDDAVPALWLRPGADADAWLRRRLLRTMGEALLGGAALLCPEHEPESVVLDVEPPGAATGEVWITETTVGGGGFLEAVADAVSASPARFFRLTRAMLRPGASQFAAAALEGAVQASLADGSISSVFQSYREATGARARTQQLHAVREALRKEGIAGTPEVVGAITTRLLRPGSSRAVDELVAGSLDRWSETEHRLGVEIPLRTWCFLDALEGQSYDTLRLDQLQLILWPRGTRTRDRQLASYNPFSDEADPAPAVLESLLEEVEPEAVEFSELETSWTDLVGRLRHDGFARLRAPGHRKRDLLDIVARSATDVVELEVLRVHPQLVSLGVDGRGDVTADLELPGIGSWLGGGGGSDDQHGARIRRVMTAGGGSTSEVEQLLNLFFASEFVESSQPLWIVSAWLSDVAVLDNRGGEMLSVAPGLPTRRLGIVEVIGELVTRGGDVRVVVREDPHNRMVVARLRDLERRTTPGTISVESRRDLHDKLLVSDRLVLEGSMNLTHRGATRNEEGVRVIGDPDDVATQRAEMSRRFGGAAL